MKIRSGWSRGDVKKIKSDKVVAGDGTTGTRRRRREEMEWYKLLVGLSM